jgi:hypothetical protein
VTTTVGARIRNEQIVPLRQLAGRLGLTTSSALAVLVDALLAADDDSVTPAVAMGRSKLDGIVRIDRAELADRFLKDSELSHA